MAELRTVLVTGASRGIGRATALRLAAAGFEVFAGVRRDVDGEKLVADAAGSLTPVRLDITSSDDIAAAVETVRAAVGDRGLYGLVNNAGGAVPALLEYLPVDELRAQLEVNLIGQHAVTTAFLPLLRAAVGRVVTIGSIGGRITGPVVGAYHVSKFGLAALTSVLRVELAHTGIKVILVEPGAMATPIWDTAVARGDELRRAMPADVGPVYASMIATARRNAAGSAKHGNPPDLTAAAVEKALTVARPRTRYLVGRDARLLAVVARLPDKLRDKLTIKASTTVSGA